jgi:hypothetical protein
MRNGKCEPRHLGCYEAQVLIRRQLFPCFFSCDSCISWLNKIERFKSHFIRGRTAHRARWHGDFAGCGLARAARGTLGHPWREWVRQNFVVERTHRLFDANGGG